MTLPLVNADKVRQWSADIDASVLLYNTWFFEAAPKAYRDTRAQTISQVLAALKDTRNMSDLSVERLRANPEIIAVLRMMTSPPLARDRLIGLGGINSAALVKRMEEGLLPKRASEIELQLELVKIVQTVERLLDFELLHWLDRGTDPTENEVHIAAMVIADRLCGSIADPIIRNAQEARQLALIAEYLEAREYSRQSVSSATDIRTMEPGTYSFRQNVVVGDETSVNIPIDVVVQPRSARMPTLPILIECKSAGDFTNTNKRRKEEAQKVNQLRQKYGSDVPFYLFLCGYFNSGYLGYEAAEGIDWIWEHRIDDLAKLGL